jgi:hypothetical protein
MKIVMFLAGILYLQTAVHASTATVNIRPTAIVSGDSFTLGEIATVNSPDTALRVQILDATMGRCPLVGLTRPLTLGDVNLKLRQAGVDPATISFIGATSIVISESGGTSPTATSAVSAPVTTGRAPIALPLLSPSVPVQATFPNSSTVQNAPQPVVVHRGDSLTLVLNDGVMSISATVVAMGAGSVGDTIQVRRDGASQAIQGTIQDAHTVTLVE